MSKKRIVLGGIRGKMGSFLLPGFQVHPDLEIVAGLGEMADLAFEIPVYSDVEELYDEVEFDLYVDFTIYEFSLNTCKWMLEKKIPIVVGTTGFKSRDIEDLQDISRKHGVGGIIAPNFAIGVVLLHQFSKMATKYFNHFALYEYHHLSKHDNPSGTALYLSDAIKEAQCVEHVNVHGFRLPGVLATHTVIISDESQKLELTHQSNNRYSFEVGVLLAIDKISELDHLVYGLEHILI